MTITRYDPQTNVLQASGSERLDEPGPMWIDVEAPTAEEMALLASRFGLHRLAVEDVLHLNQRPKLEEYPSHLFLVVHGFRAAKDTLSALEIEEMHVLLAQDWVITVHEHPSPSTAEAERQMRADPAATFGRGMDFVAYLVCDAVVDQNFPLLSRFSDELEELESAVFVHAHQPQLEKIFALRRSLVSVRRVLSPARDVMGLLTRRGTPHVQERTTIYFRDIYDHLIRLHEEIDANRDLLGNAMEGYLSMVANRTNDITKQLTIFATIFLPLSFITGFFGQNFPVLTEPPLLWVMLASVISFPICLLLWFRRRHWI